MTDEKALAACSHCGDLAWMHEGPAFQNGVRGYRVECEGDCHSMTCWWHTEAEARAAWNRRVPEPAPADKKALREALTPSEGTKAAYIGEFEFPVKAYDEDGEEVTFPATVPWTTIKEIMAAILARTLLAHEAPKEQDNARS